MNYNKIRLGQIINQGLFSSLRASAASATATQAAAAQNPGGHTDAPGSEEASATAFARKYVGPGNFGFFK
jgi:hypothetical protein